MLRLTKYRVVVVVSGCALLAIIALVPGRLGLPRPSGESLETTVTSNPTSYGSSVSVNSNEMVSLYGSSSKENDTMRTWPTAKFVYQIGDFLKLCPNFYYGS